MADDGRSSVSSASSEPGSARGGEGKDIEAPSGIDREVQPRLVDLSSTHEENHANYRDLNLPEPTHLSPNLVLSTDSHLLARRRGGEEEEGERKSSSTRSAGRTVSLDIRNLPHTHTHAHTHTHTPSSSSCCIICILASAALWRGGAITEGGGGPNSPWGEAAEEEEEEAKATPALTNCEGRT